MIAFRANTRILAGSRHNRILRLAPQQVIEAEEKWAWLAWPSVHPGNPRDLPLPEPHGFCYAWNNWCAVGV